MRWTLGFVFCLLIAGGCHSKKEPLGNADDDSKSEEGDKPSKDAGKDGGRKDGGKDAKVDSHENSDADVDDPPEGDIEPESIDACSDSELDKSTIEALKKGGEPGQARFTYPYDGTVFPRGIKGPLVAWDKVDAADAVYVHIKSTAFEYHGCLKPTGANELQLPDDVWDKAGSKTYGKRDPFQVELTVSSGGKVTGPLTQKWIIAQATIKGSIYYNSYSSLKGGSVGGQVFRIPPKGEAEPFLTVECNGCHSLAANGSRMTSQTLGTNGRSWNTETGKAQSIPNPISNTAYSAMYPDGSHYLVGSQVLSVGRSNIAAPFTTTNKALMYETDTSKAISMSGIPADTLMPSFSPDGSMLVFNDFAIGSGYGLALVDYDAKAHAGSNYRELVRTDLNRPGWPFLLPDNHGVVYVEADPLSDWSAQGAGVAVASVTSVIAPYSDMFLVDVETGNKVLLSKAMGFNDEAGKDNYLPFGEAEVHHNYFPTVSPVAAGGYFWVFWDSLRHYGNKGLSRQLWGTAIEIQKGGEFGVDYGQDLSHPAFYIPGQEFGTGNHRAFTALDPCRDDGASCETGVDCCGGSCDTTAGTPGVCKKRDTCAKTDEACDTDEDCCKPMSNKDLQNHCIAGYCASLIL